MDRGLNYARFKKTRFFKETMSTKKVLLLHISNISGHCRASLAIEKALKELDQGVQILRVNAFSYLNPYAEKMVNMMYMFTIQSLPQLWDYLYDNESVFKKMKNARKKMIQ